MDQWIHDEILDGLSKLLCLSLERTPASDMIAGTAMAWCEALTDSRCWDERLDAPRFRKAFVKRAQIRRVWPAPADFMDALPTREQLAITKQPIPASPARVNAAVAEVANLLHIDRKTAAAGPDA